MPDPLRKTISATEAPALFDVSPYITRWMLFQRFANGKEADQVEHARMDWGKKLEPLVLEQAAQELKFEVRPNVGPDGKQAYIRNGLLGCTRDSDIICPDRGPGACEVKCVFDYRIWMQDWNGGNNPPRHYEIQLQQQMRVGDGKDPYKWGVEVVWVAGEVLYFERKPVPEFWTALDGEAARFFRDVANNDEPEPFGSPREYPLLNKAFPIQEDLILDWRHHDDGPKLAEMVRMYAYHREHRLAHSKGEESLKARIRAICREHGKLLLPEGINVKLKQNKTGVGMKVYVPPNLPEGKLGHE